MVNSYRDFGTVNQNYVDVLKTDALEVSFLTGLLVVLV